MIKSIAKDVLSSKNTSKIPKFLVFHFASLILQEAKYPSNQIVVKLNYFSVQNQYSMVPGC